MEQIINLLHFDIAKYKDIFNILHKLEEDGAVQEISGLFHKIFSSESQYTLGELEKIQRERSDKINVSRQYENNLSLFKTNFYLIVQLLVENAFKVVLKENQNKIQEKQEATDNTTETQEDEITPSKKERPPIATKKFESPSQKVKKESTEKNSQVSGKKKSKNEKSPSAALRRIVNSKEAGSRSSRTSKDYERENSHLQTQSYSSASKKQSNQNSSVTSSSLMPVSSEFNHIQGPASFGQSERRFLDVNLTSPGPAFYETSKASPSNFRRSVSPTIGKAEKKTWVEISTNTPSPGPGGLYPSHHFISK